MTDPRKRSYSPEPPTSLPKGPPPPPPPGSANQEITDLSAEVARLTAENGQLRDQLYSVTRELQRYQPAGSPPPGDVSALAAWVLQTLDAALSAANKALDFHPRAAKLMRKRKNFVVIACDEPYFMDAYDLIRDSEIQKGTWTVEDQWHYDDAKATHRALVNRGIS